MVPELVGPGTPKALILGFAGVLAVSHLPSHSALALFQAGKASSVKPTCVSNFKTSFR